MAGGSSNGADPVADHRLHQRSMLGFARADPGERIDSPILETLIRETIISIGSASAQEAKSPLVPSFALALVTCEEVPKIARRALQNLASTRRDQESTA